MKLSSYLCGHWSEGKATGQDLHHAVSGEKIYEVTSEGLPLLEAMDYAKRVGGPALRKMTFHQRALMIKTMAQDLLQHKEKFYEISKATGATRKDSWIDIEGGIGTLFVYASKGRRDFPNERFHLDGDTEIISKNGTFLGRHICVPLEGVAIHINAFNFPCWGMLEKIAPTLLAGVPAIVKPASITSFLAWVMVKRIIDSKILPEGSLQLVCGSVGNMLDQVTGQDIVTFTGSASTGLMLKSKASILKNSTRFNMEADSLNFSLLGEDAHPGSEEYKLYLKEVVNEMTVKAGQKCTAIRRAFVPEKYLEDVQRDLKKELSLLKLGSPDLAGIHMGPLVGKTQVKEVQEKVAQIAKVSQVIFGGLDQLDDSLKAGSFFPWTLLSCTKPHDTTIPHQEEAFGPVCTIMPYKNVDDAAILIKKGEGSLVGSIFSHNSAFATDLILQTASYHGRIVVLNRDCAKESTGHGSPLPHLVHGGPGRAGGGEELGGSRSVLHYMQRTAIQGHPTLLSYLGKEWVQGGETYSDRIHPFRKYFEELKIGESLMTPRRTVTEADIVNFAGISGDFFYAHMDELAAKDSLFKKRVAHGYFVLSAAAGLFVEPAVGPVLANYGLEKLRFVTPVGVGDTIQVQLTCKKKTERALREGEDPCGVVLWDVMVKNQLAELVASYQILTLVKRQN